MELVHEIRREPEYLVVAVAGRYEFHALVEVIALIRPECERQQVFKTLLDLSRMENYSKGIDRYYHGEEAGRLGGAVKLAVLGKPQQYDDGFGETTAVNLGAHLRVFTDRDSALGWLLDERT